MVSWRYLIFRKQWVAILQKSILLWFWLRNHRAKVLMPGNANFIKSWLVIIYLLPITYIEDLFSLFYLCFMENTLWILIIYKPSLLFLPQTSICFTRGSVCLYTMTSSLITLLNTTLLRAPSAFSNTGKFLVRDNQIFCFLHSHYSETTLNVQLFIFMKRFSVQHTTTVSKYFKNIW